MAFLLCIFAILSFALCTVETREIVESLQLPQDSLPPFDKPHDSQESVNRLNLLNVIHELSKFEHEILPQEFKEKEEQEKTQKREAESDLTTRRPCRKFYWKSWAAC